MPSGSRSRIPRTRFAGLQWYNEMCRSFDFRLSSLPMNLAVVCPHCGHRFKVAAKYAGRLGRCPDPRCGQTYTVPHPESVSAEARADDTTLDAEQSRGESLKWGARAVYAAQSAKPRPRSWLNRIDQPSFLMGLGTTAVITIGALIVWSWLPGKPGLTAGVEGPPIAAESAPPPRNVFGEDILPILAQHCARCHTGDEAQGGFVLTDHRDEQSVLKHRRQWERLTNLVSTGLMPPADEPQPTATEKQQVLDYLESTLFHLDCAQITDPGHVTIRRLNRFEYNNTVRDLLGVTFQPAADFPSDDVGHGFDNIGDMLSLPPLLMEKYLTAAEKIADEVIIAIDPRDPKRLEFAAEQMRRGDAAHLQDAGVMIVSVGQTFVEWNAPVAGTYVLAAEAAETPAGNEPAKMEFRLDGKGVQTFAVDNEETKPRLFEHTLQVERGQHQFAAAFLNDFYDPKNKDPERRDRNLLVVRMEIRGPIDADPAQLPAAHRMLLARHPRDGQSSAECARENLQSFLPRAFRRPIRDEELEPFVKLVVETVERGESFEFAMRVALTGVLVSPQFLFRGEADPNPQDAAGIHPVGDYELASRLSYFLWSSLPDDELLRHAAQGDLQTDAVLDAQVKRMLADPKSTALVDGFVTQWLNLKSLDDRQPDPNLFPEYSPELKAGLLRETQLFALHILRKDQSILDFLDGRYTFVDERLAKLYGLPNVSGDEFQQVSLAGTPRAGLLTQGSILTLTSTPTRTSPVKRGKWILEVILDQAPPPPPPNVPELAETAQAAPDATLREQLEIHRANPVCASCHLTMDALGFGMENFDAIGRFRETDAGQPLDTSGTLPGGKMFSGPQELIAVLKQRDCDFAKAFTNKLLTYALGRGLEYYDRCAVDKIVETVKQQDFKFSVLIGEIVKSRPFRLRRSEGSES